MRSDCEVTRTIFSETTVTHGECLLQYGATAYDAVYMSFCLSKNLPLITAEKTTTAWVTKLRDRIEAAR